MNSTTNFAKNFIIFDYCTTRTKRNTYVLRDTYRSIDMYNIISPNIILYSIYDNFLELDLTKSNTSFVFFSLMKTFETLSKQINDVTADSLMDIINPIVKETYEYRNNNEKNISYMSDVENNIYNLFITNDETTYTDNNVFLMEIALLISFYAKTADENLKNLSEFVNKISKNSIKILSFISIGIFAYYAKMYSITNDNLYKKEKWMNRLIDLFMDGSIKKYLNYIDNNEYKKFMFMIIKYTVTVESIDLVVPYSRINKIKQCFLTEFQELYDHIPGYTADQLFLITYDLFTSSHNWMLMLASSSMLYTELSHMNIIMSWYYFMLNDEDVSKYFNIHGSDFELNRYNNNANDITQLMNQSSS